MKNSSGFEWHKRFKGGRDNADDDDDERRGCPRSHKTDANSAMPVIRSIPQDLDSHAEWGISLIFTTSPLQR